MVKSERVEKSKHGVNSSLGCGYYSNFGTTDDFNLYLFYIF